MFPQPSFSDSSSEPIKLRQEGNSNEEQEVFLSFNYRNFFNKVITAYYEDGNYYLPVSEIFSSLKISHEVNNENLTIEGFYLEPENTFYLDFSNYQVELANKGFFSLDASQMRVKELDYYIKMEVLATVFDLNFSVDMNNLLLQLETPLELPVVSEYKRQQRRERQERATIGQELHPLLYERDRKLVGGAFFDYSLSSFINNTENAYAYNFDIGSELLGGDLEGSAYGNYTSNYSNFTTNNLRWRYVLRNNDYLTQFYAGQTTSNGLIDRNFTGVRLTNEPIEPRYLYDSYEIEGTAPIGSEVELYYNNSLYDFRRITEDEQFRFIAPLTYGTSRLRLRIYGPDGRVREREQRIQVPFNFLPKDEVTYHLNAGRLNNPILGSTEESYLAQGSVAYGLSDWLTQKIGIEYFDQFSDQVPLFYSSTSARLFDDYLFNADIAPNAFYRLSGNVIYPSSASWGLNYTYFSDERIYNPIGNNHELSANLFIPFQIAELPLNIRFTGDYTQNSAQNRDNIYYNLDLNSRINRLNLRLSFRDRQFESFTLSPSSSSELRASATYLISPQTNLPRYLQNTFVSTSARFNPGSGTFQEAQIQASRSVFDKGRIQASFARNFAGNFNFMNVGLIIDFNSIRSTSTIRNNRNQTSFTQNFRGSVGYDDYNNDLTFSNRNQVGRSATSLRLYVDSNNSGSYDEEDNTIQDDAIRIGRAGVQSTSKDGIFRFSQLQSYHRINMEINESAIQNPLLVPEFKEFSIVTDPNQYKPINIPFYTSGVVSGKVVQLEGESSAPLSGVRLYLESKQNDYSKEMQTFNDGSFYAHQIPPDSYRLYIDPNQLQFLNAFSEPDTMTVEVEAIAEGDFVENLNFKVIPKSGSDKSNQPEETRTYPEEAAQDTTIEKDKNSRYQIQIASFKTAEKAKKVSKDASKIINRPFKPVLNVLNNLYAIRSSFMDTEQEAIELFRTLVDNDFESNALVVQNRTKLLQEEADSVLIFHNFKTLQNARKSANQIARNTNKEVSIGQFRGKQDFVIYQKKRAISRKDTSAFQTTEYQKKYEEARIINLHESEVTLIEQKKAMNFTFQIQVRGIKTASQKTNLQTFIQDKPQLSIDKGEDASTYILEGFQKWSYLKKIQMELDQFHHDLAIPILIEE
ncbi:hypothetical protein LQ318_06990 [Aliifodinibius salicampi]|uniref:SPOR domain-containing protein n=1 Tax=Fodinibius salicampi TaxID=1920655 RepID=A0ABT3PXQ5_9BACT|nr:hypothetical protein [Fodinibius salicampi]MCW9712645.1 hypothetical protein [Fodinibius salicampi]